MPASFIKAFGRCQSEIGRDFPAVPEMEVIALSVILPLMTQSTVQIVAGVLAVLLVVIIIMRRKNKKKDAEDEF